MDDQNQYVSNIRVRLSASDAHYGGQLVNGAHMLALFGDVATELAILCDGDEGLLVGYEKIEFLAPLFAGATACPRRGRAVESRGETEGLRADSRVSPRESTT